MGSSGYLKFEIKQDMIVKIVVALAWARHVPMRRMRVSLCNWHSPIYFASSSFSSLGEDRSCVTSLRAWRIGSNLCNKPGSERIRGNFQLWQRLVTYLDETLHLPWAW